MNTSEQLIIPFRGLNNGKHDFQFKLSEKFFKGLDYSEFGSGKIDVDVELDKKSTHLVLEIELKGKVNVMCDRCLDYFDTDVDFYTTLVVKFSGNSEDSNDEIMILSPDEFDLDLTHYVYESVCLSLPYHRYHPEKKGKSGCNKEMLKKMKELETNQAEHIGETDPRWEKLKNLNNN